MASWQRLLESMQFPVWLWTKSERQAAQKKKGKAQLGWLSIYSILAISHGIQCQQHSRESSRSRWEAEVEVESVLEAEVGERQGPGLEVGRQSCHPQVAT